MAYYIDLEKISIDAYRIKLELAYLPPSRMMLKDKLDERFGYFKGLGIENAKALLQVLKKRTSLPNCRRLNAYLAVI
ncbi:MAG: hypothetical protein HC896_12560 [Bacteroidales bacterium]|nr:hypothetical protein [Bacteroidales bacterium]